MVSSKKNGKWRFVAWGVLGLVVLFVMLWKLSSLRRFQLFGRLVPRVSTSEKLVALTFDDGPTSKYTHQVLSVLKEHGVKATFFVTGRELKRNMPQGKQIVKAGHELGNHSFSHSRMVLMSYGRVKREIDKTNALIREAGHKGPVTFRPPYGKKLFMLPYYLSEKKMTTIMWDLEPDSQKGVSVVGLRDAVLSGTRPGSIILLHAMYKSRETSRKALPGIIAGLRKRGYRFVTVSELLKRQRVSM